jgi:putative Mg2+ transporter-C (MgtC) family protein
VIPVPTPAWTGPGLRILAAVLSGSAVGLNRDLHHKPIGIRTMAMVALASCILVLAVGAEAHAHGSGGSDQISRVTQGIVSGLGFLGAGVILRGPDESQIHGLTTAAAILVVAALGVACGLAAWPILLLGLGATLLVLTVGGPVERTVQRYAERRQVPRPR